MTTVAACAMLAVLELDAVLVAQTMVSRPLVVGAVLGAATGSVQAGALFGLAFELLSLCDLPIGGCLTWSGSVAVGTATLLASRGTSFPLCFAGGVAAGVLHARVEALERSRRAATGDALAVRAETDPRALGREIGTALASHAAMTFVVASAMTALIGYADARWWADAPRFLRSWATFAAASAPWIGLSGVVAWSLRRA